MFGRFLSFLGFIPGLSGLSGLAGGYGSGGGGMEEDLEADGEAAVSFKPGIPLAAADSEETPDSRRARITDRDLVWPGKIETIQISNPEQIAYRFDLTVTDLNPAFYIRRPPQGGVPQREGGVLLQPGDGASFEVVFVPPPAGEKLRTRTFGFVLTCFDPRRSGDPGEIVQDLPLRWVALPTEADLQITAAPPVVVTRPWRREARLAVRLANKSFLPPTVAMTILRAPTKDALERDAETVGAIQQSLGARTPGVWRCLLPPSARHGSYYATVRGAAQAADSVSVPLALPRPVLVRYVAWLRMGRDWAALIGTLLFLFWLAWGLPVQKHPVIEVTPAFQGAGAGQPPEGANPRDLSATMTLLDEDNTPLAGQPTIVGSYNGSRFVLKGPDRWYGDRWPFGWSWPRRFHQRYQLSLAPKEGKEEEFSDYVFPALSDTAYLDAKKVPTGDWKIPQTIPVAQAPGAVVLIKVGDLGGLTDKNPQRLTINYELDGQPQTRIFPLYRDAHNGFKPVPLNLTDQVPPGKSRQLILSATILKQKSNDSGASISVRRQQDPFTFPEPLTFPATLTSTPEQMAVAAKAEALAKANQDAADKKKQAQAAAARAKAAASPGKGAAGRTTAPPPIAPLPPIRPIKSAGPGGSALGAGPGGLAHPGGPMQTIPYHPPIFPASNPPIHPITVHTLPPAAPAVPSGLTAQPTGPTQINVRWNPVADAAKYILYRSGGPGAGGPEKHLDAGQTSFSDTGLTPGVIYHYRIQSKRGARMSPQSDPISVLTRALVTAPAIVTLTLSAEGRNVHAFLDFSNVSGQTVYLDKVSACAGHKIGDAVFRIQADGQPVPFTGQKSKRPSDPGPRQFITLLPNESVRQDVVLNHSYRFPSGTHTYTVTYSATHDYPGRFQNLTLTSAAAGVVAPQ